MTSVWWCGWDVPHDVPIKVWPAGMHGWITGESCDSFVWAGRIEAPNAASAEAIVRSCYGKYADVVRMRWEPKPRARDWWPASGRFPRGAP